MPSDMEWMNIMRAMSRTVMEEMMNELAKRIGKYIIKVLIVDILLVGIAFIISYYSKVNFSDVLVYIGIFCLIIGGFSMMGNNRNSADANYFMSKSVGSKSTNEATEENFNNRNSSMKFLIFMFCVGGLLIAMVVLIDYVLK